jgi:trans-2,3-dihydro-3-hydroxyanthranilate isomerase
MRKSLIAILIFTPVWELPFAGNPTVGTAFILAGMDRNAKPGLLFEKAGLVSLEIVREEGRAIGAELAAPQQLIRHSRLRSIDVAGCLSLGDRWRRIASRSR